MSFNQLFAALRQKQNAPEVAQPALGTLQKTTPSQPAPFQTSSSPWQNQLANAIDWSSAGGDAWNKLGKDGVINYMGDSLRKRYGTDNLSNFRYIEDANTPGGYRLDWQGRQPVTSFLGGIKDASRSAGLSIGAGAGDGGDGLGSGMSLEDPSKALNFGATWEGEGGTTFGFYRKPDGSVGIKTNQTQSNETGDIIAALAILGGGYMAGTGALGGAAGGAGAAEGAAAAGAAEGAAVGSGAGFVGEGALSGIGAWDAALAASPSWTAAGGMAGAAGVTDLGGGLSMGADGAITGATGLNPSTLTNAGIMDSVGYGGAGVSGVGGAGGGSGSAGGSMTGTPPPANPYNPASYLDATNLKNLAGSAMSDFSWTDLIGPGLQLVGGAMNADAAKDAADTQLQAAREAAARFEPWRQAGAWGIGRGATMLGKEGPEAARTAFQASPDYQFRMEEQAKALERARSAGGLLGSGKYLKDALKYSGNLASGEFGNSFNRLMALAGMGQTATQSSSDFLTQGANAQAAGRVGQANAWNNALGQGYSMYSDNRLMRGLGY